jgi:hypothetical protein
MSLVFFGTYRHAYRNETWPKTEGIIESIEINPGQKYGTFYVRIGYSYWVDGKQYHATSFNPTSNRVGEKDVNRIKEQYRGGGKYAVAFNPDEPSESFVETETVRRGDEPLVIGIVFALIGVYALKGAWSEWRNRS